MISHTRARYGAVSPARRPGGQGQGQGQGQAGSHPSRTNRAMPDAHKAQRRGASASCRYSHRHRPRPARLQRQRAQRSGEEQAGALMCPALLPAGRPPPSLGAPGRRGCVVMHISIACALCMLTCTLCCVISQATGGRPRATTGPAAGTAAVPMPCQLATHIKQASRKLARQGPRVYVRTCT